MLDQDLNLRYAPRHPERRQRPCVITFAGLSLVVASGSGSGRGALLPQAPVEIIRGEGSAEATIELEKRGDDLKRARVIDAVLGTGEAEIISDERGRVEFTIDFPAGATITHRGQHADSGKLDDAMLSGTRHRSSGRRSWSRLRRHRNIHMAKAFTAP